MTTSSSFERLTDEEKSLIDARIFVRECRRLQNLSDGKASSPEYRNTLESQHIPAKREEYAWALLMHKCGAPPEFLQAYLESLQADVENAERILIDGLSYGNIYEGPDTKQKLRTRNGQIDFSALTDALDHLPRASAVELAQDEMTRISGVSSPANRWIARAMSLDGNAPNLGR